jgi:hypothetical protein
MFTTTKLMETTTNAIPVHSPSLPLAYVQNQIITHNFRIMIYLGERKKKLWAHPSSN